MRNTYFILGLSTALAAALAGCSSTPYNPNYEQTTQYKGSNPYATTQAPAVQQATYQTQPTSYVTQTQAAAPITYAEPISYNGQTGTYTRVNTQCLKTEGNRKMIGTVGGGVVGGLAGRAIAGKNKTIGTVAGAAIGGLAGHGIADKTINCDPIPVQVSQTATITPAYTGQPMAAIPASTTSVYADSPTTARIQENTQSFGASGTPGYYAVNGGQPTEVALAHTSSANTDAATGEAATVTVINPVPISAQSGLGGYAMYTVEPGNTVYSLARETCVSIDEIKALNNLNESFYIRIGDQIKLPTKRCAVQ